MLNDHFRSRLYSLMILLPDSIPTPGNRRYQAALLDLDDLVFRIIGQRRAYHYTEYPAIYDNDAVVSNHIRAPRRGKTPDQTRAGRARVQRADRFILLARLDFGGGRRDRQPPVSHGGACL